MKGPMSAAAFNRKMIRALHGRTDIILTRYTLYYHGKRCQVIRIASRDIKPGDKILLITTGMHGDEVAGPLFMLESVNWIIDAAHAAGAKVIIFPLMNPLGFELGIKYNPFVDEGPHDWNNDFVMHHPHGSRKLKDELGRRDCPMHWFWTSDKRLRIKGRRIRLPKETALMHRLLKCGFKRFRGQIVGALDLHEGRHDPGEPVGAFAYAFGYKRERTLRNRAYGEIARALRRAHVPVLRRRWVSEGFRSIRYFKTDKNGCVWNEHDGVLADLLNHLGVRAMTVDTQNCLARHFVRKLYRICIAHFIAYVAQQTSTAR